MLIAQQELAQDKVRRRVLWDAWCNNSAPSVRGSKIITAHAISLHGLYSDKRKLLESVKEIRSNSGCEPGRSTAYPPTKP